VSGGVCRKPGVCLIALSRNLVSLSPTSLEEGSAIMAVRIGPDGEIEAAFPVIELHHFVFRGPRKTLPELVANNGINAGAVISNRHTTLTLEDWTAAARCPLPSTA
jgi:hypothetical protein